MNILFHYWPKYFVGVCFLCSWGTPQGKEKTRGKFLSPSILKRMHSTSSFRFPVCILWHFSCLIVGAYLLLWLKLRLPLNWVHRNLSKNGQLTRKYTLRPIWSNPNDSHGANVILCDDTLSRRLRASLLKSNHDSIVAKLNRWKILSK